MTSARAATGRRDGRMKPLPRLDRMARPELVRLARQLLRERYRRTRRRAQEPPVDPDTVASEVSSALDIDWESPTRGAERQVGEHAVRARSDLRAGRWEPALRRATGIVQGYANEYDPGNDREGDLASDLHDAVEVVSDALRHVLGASPRSVAFEALLELWWADLGHGGVGLSDDVPDILRRRATPRERVRLADEIQARLTETQPGFEREHAARMIVDLDGGRFKDEEYLEFCRSNGLHLERVARLVSRQRFQEAANVAEADVPRYRLTEAAVMLVKAGQPELAVQMVQKRLQDPEDRVFHDRWKEWLQGQAEARNDLLKARSLAWERLRDGPSMATYGALKRVSRRGRTWSTDEPDVLHLLQRPDLGDLLTQVHLEEGRVGDALRAFRKWSQGRSHEGGIAGLQEQVASAAQKSFPEESRDLYLELAEAAISRKTRRDYAYAAPFVRIACVVEKRVRGTEGPKEILRSLHRRYEGFPALWDELGKVGLG
jgi:hypothetical protein